MTTAERRCRICRWLLKPEKKTCGYCGTLYDDAQPPPPSPREEEQAARRGYSAELNRRLEANRAAIRKAARSSRHAAAQAWKAQTLEARLTKPARVVPNTDRARIEALHAGETIWVRDAYNLVSAEMRVNGDRIDVRYSVVGHNNVRGEPRVYGESLEMTPSQALDWFGQLSDRALRNELPPPIRQLRDELD